MSVADLFNLPKEAEINSKKYQIEYDNAAYCTLEHMTGKGIFKIYDMLMFDNNLGLNDSIELVCCSLLKHYKTDEIDEVRKYLNSNIGALRNINPHVFAAFVEPLLPPDVRDEINSQKKRTTEQKLKDSEKAES